MDEKLRLPRAGYVNPIALWLLIHGGDPPPGGGEEPRPIDQLSTLLAIHRLADSLSEAATRREIQSAAGKAAGHLSQILIKGDR